MATDSAQPMSWPSATQPSIKHQPAYWFSNAKLRLKEEDASTCMFGLRHYVGNKELIMA